MTTVAEALRAATARLRSAGIESAAIDARSLLAHALGYARARLTLYLPDAMPGDAQARLAKMISARLARQPVAQIIGKRAFYGRDFHISPAVLDPRPETETLIEVALATPFTRLLDLGTGSGCIVLTLLGERVDASGLGIDTSAQALEVARENARSLDIPRATFFLSDWFAAVTGKFDLIVANPPYIAPEEMPGLAGELRWEPRQALCDEVDGLSAYRAIISAARAHLLPAGFLIVEIGPTQGAAVRAFLAQAGFDKITVIRDLDGRDRVVRAQNRP